MNQKAYAKKELGIDYNSHFNKAFTYFEKHGFMLQYKKATKDWKAHYALVFYVPLKDNGAGRFEYPIGIGWIDMPFSALIDANDYKKQIAELY